MAGNVQELTETSFESTVLKSAKPVLVDFWAVWCGPCRQVAPIVESLATKWGDKVTVTKLNVDDVPSVAERYGIMSIPDPHALQGRPDRRARRRRVAPGFAREEVRAAPELRPGEGFGFS